MRKRKEKEKRDLIFDSIENKYTIKINNTSKLTHTCKFSEKVPFKDFYFFKSVVRHKSKKDLWTVIRHQISVERYINKTFNTSRE